MRNALVTSIISLLLCVSMLVGTTFAWFTDEVVTGMNTIAAGNLDIELLANGKSVATETKLFDDVELWEPGVVVYENLQIANVGTLALKYQMTLNFGNENDLNGHKLSEVLKIAVIDKIADNATRAEVLAAAEAAQATSLADFNVTGMLEAGASTDEQTYVIFWKANENEVDNLYNANNGQETSDKQPLHIDFGVKLFATQQMLEEDSFGPDYDGAAAWTTLADTAWYSENATEFIIYSAEELAGFAALVNEGKSFAGQTVKLGGNIDLAGHPWTPIGNWDNAFAGTFDGQGFTISNLYMNDAEGEGIGLFGVVEKATIKNFTINNVNITGYSMVAAVVGAAYPATISNCHVTGSINIVSEWAYVAGISGYNYYGTQVDGCSTVAAGTGLIKSNTRNAVGGITAWLLEGNHNVTNCQVKNLNLVGWTNVGGVTGFVHYNNTIDNCSVENVKLIKTRVDGNPGIGLIAGGWSYSAANAITLSNNTVKTATMDGTHVAYSAYNELYGSEYGGATTANFVLDNNTTENITNNLQEIVKASASSLKDDVKVAGATVYVPAGNYTFPSGVAEDVTITCAEGVTFTGKSGLNIKGATVVGATFSNPSGSAVGGTVNGNFKDCTFTGSNALRSCYITAGTTSTFENCVFSGDVYGVHFDGSAGGKLVFKGCTFSGFNAFAEAIEMLTLEECTFASNGRSGYNGINAWGDTEMIGCTFLFDGSANTEWAHLRGENKTMTLTGCEFTDGTNPVDLNNYLAKPDSGKIIIDGAEWIPA